MRVVKSGKQPRKKCKRCKAVLEYNGSDIEQRRVPHWLGVGMEVVSYIVCPECGAQIVL